MGLSDSCAGKKEKGRVKKEEEGEGREEIRERISRENNWQESSPSCLIACLIVCSVPTTGSSLLADINTVDRH